MKERKLDIVINDYYQNKYVEDERLTKDKMHYIEFLTTKTYIDKYLKNGDKILEVGAGTGAYSLHYASKGYSVDALELVNSNIKLLKSKITSKMNIRAQQGNAIDLSMYADNTFDITLVLGPLYHLFKKDEKQKAISEALRVTKKHGKVLIAFTLFDLTLLTWGFKDKNIYENIGSMVTNDFKPNNREELIFNMYYFEEVKYLINKFNFENVYYVATDGIAQIMKDDINNMTDKEYELFLKYHLSVCEREDLIGLSGHILAILEK